MCFWKIKAGFTLQSEPMYLAVVTTVWEEMPKLAPLWMSHWEPSPSVTLKQRDAADSTCCTNT